MAYSDDNRIALTVLVFSLTIVMVAVPAAVLVLGNGSGNFAASATVSNTPPTIQVDPSQNVGSGTPATSKAVYLYFNATDLNGATDLNDSTMNLIINRTGNTARANTSCSMSAVNSSTRRYNCTVNIWYFDEAGTWTINASIKDNSVNFVNDTTQSATLGTIDNIVLVNASIAFSGSPGTTNNAASPNPETINNTGNVNYQNVSLTGISFANGTNTLSVGNVSVNITNSGGLGQVLVNNTAINITGGSTLPRGNNSVRDLYFWLNIPTGQPSGAYNATSSWTIATY